MNRIIVFFVMLLSLLTAGLADGTKTRFKQPVSTRVDDIYVFSLDSKDIDFTFSIPTPTRKDLTSEYLWFGNEAERIKKDKNCKQQVYHMFTQILNRHNRFFISVLDGYAPAIPLKIHASFSPDPEGDLLAIDATVTIYLGNGILPVMKGKAYTSTSYPPYGSPFIQAVKEALNTLTHNRMMSVVKKYKAINAVILQARPLTGNKRKENPGITSKQNDSGMQNYIKEFLRTQKALIGEIKIIATKVDRMVRETAVIPGNRPEKKEDVRKLAENIQTYSTLLDTDIDEYLKGTCLVLNSGGKKEENLNTVIVKLPDGKALKFPVVENCNKLAPTAKWVTCKKKGNVYYIKKENMQFLAVSKARGLQWIKQQFKGRTIAR